MLYNFWTEFSELISISKFFW